MLDHLNEIDFEPEVLDTPDEGFVTLKKADASLLLEAKIRTADWLKELGAADDEEIITGAEKQQASEVFHALTTASDQAKQAVTGLTTPPQIKALVGMLTAYEWQFVEEAQRLRSMAVAKLVEETEHPDARIRLKAIELLGKVTEVGLFTERVTVKKEELEDHELDERIREKLKQLQKTVDAEATEKEERNSDVEDVELSLEPKTGEDDDAAEPS